jgi:tetratricopeptide (TPR) repeat protein
VRRHALAIALLAVAALGAGSARARLVELERARRVSQELLYLPNGKYLKAVSLGHAPLVADFVYIWAIQYYSDYERQDRYRYVEHVFGNVIAELDPAYTDPYWLGALILTTEANDVDAGLRLLDKGFAANPSAWVLPYVAGWECHRAGRFAQAADYFDLAAKAPGAPASIFRLKAGMTERAGHLREAIARWRDVLDDPRNDAGARAIASRQIRTLTVRADIHDLDEAIARYRERIGRLPQALAELAEAGIVRAVPQDPDGKPYDYDPVAGTVSSSAVRVLGS